MTNINKKESDHSIDGDDDTSDQVTTFVKTIFLNFK